MAARREREAAKLKALLADVDAAIDAVRRELLREASLGPDNGCE
jgi:hypothetical protein